MPLYDFECRECKYSEEIFQGYSDPGEKECPKCNHNSFRIVINSCPHVSVKQYNTIGSLADKNWNQMGHYEKESKMKKDGLNEIIEKKEKKKKQNKLANMTQKQKTKYIETGEL